MAVMSGLAPARFILGVLTVLGPGGLPGPMLAPRGDIFCLDFGLDWAGRLPAWLKPILGPDWLTEGGRGAMALEIAVLPGGADGTVVGLVI